MAGSLSFMAAGLIVYPNKYMWPGIYLL